MMLFNSKNRFVKLGKFTEKHLLLVDVTPATMISSAFRFLYTAKAEMFFKDTTSEMFHNNLLK